jgi:ABC-type glycerol-3-phosphate transport system substrate-binding protein
MLVAVAGCGGGAGPSPSGGSHADSASQLYQQAKSEGEVDFWGPEDKDEIQALAAVFNKTYPGVRVVDFEIEAGDMVPKIITGSRAGDPGLDADSATPRP